MGELGGGGTRTESNCQKEGQVLEDMNSDEEQLILISGYETIYMAQ